MIALGSDHGGFALKQHIKDYLDSHGLEYQDFATTPSLPRPPQRRWPLGSVSGAL